jgi:hypothetical protein
MPSRTRGEKFANVDFDSGSAGAFIEPLGNRPINRHPSPIIRLRQIVASVVPRQNDDEVRSFPGNGLHGQ